MIAQTASPTPAELLDPHGHRVLRRFLAEHTDDGLDTAIFDLAYGDLDEVSHDLATEVEAELLRSSKRISDLIAGWRPRAIRDSVPATR